MALALKNRTFSSRPLARLFTAPETNFVLAALSVESPAVRVGTPTLPVKVGFAFGAPPRFASAATASATSDRLFAFFNALASVAAAFCSLIDADIAEFAAFVADKAAADALPAAPLAELAASVEADCAAAAYCDACCSLVDAAAALAAAFAAESALAAADCAALPAESSALFALFVAVSAAC
ncbi:hypothetical protein [Burkholderia multivorans]|uniref:hypothetical protein n=1 Tax=Burkholderia multivorans TaxID=87883 RepID=UPI0015EBFB12|nr:hypothetical protein [Burkholderia multivorans]